MVACLRGFYVTPDEFRARYTNYIAPEESTLEPLDVPDQIPTHREGHMGAAIWGRPVAQ